uniref:Upper zone of growth plate and cartilage matrix associated n=1 Tax=Myotis myotis TaxID=51298 RepID=A0A7J8AS40_MYOMY|nr:upper zone of growth plate and cartilage matrix associated [Myotis myotis]
MPQISLRSVANGPPNPEMRSTRRTGRSCGLTSYEENITRNNGTSLRTSWRSKMMNKKRETGRLLSSGASGIMMACTHHISITATTSDLILMNLEDGA